VHPRSILWRALRTALVLAALTTTAQSGATDRDLSESPDFRVRVQAALRLGRVGGAQSRADLEQSLRDPHPAVRVACAAGLGTIGDPAAIPALERAMKTEGSDNVKTAMKETIDKLHGGSGGGGGSDPAAGIDRAKYIVQLGSMRNTSGVRSDDLDAVMRKAARTRANNISGAVVLDSADAAVLRKATERKIPVLLIDGNLTRLTQTEGNNGVVISAKFDMAIRKVPQQTLKGTVSGNASGSGGLRASPNGLLELQNRVVGGAVESAVNSMSAEIAALTR
jgi:HEAT repeat protein